MDFAAHPFFQWISQYAYEPTMVYAAVFVMMLASGFGFPIPEEIYIVSIGILAYMGANPEHFPPPYAGAEVVNGYEAAAVTLVAVVFADCVVFSLGRVFGKKLIGRPRMQKIFSPQVMDRINLWVRKYGILAAFLFRFTPGIRFPGHVALGMTNLSSWKFIAVDFVAALISVPTQILLIYHFGEPILSALYQFKIYFIAVLGVVAVFFIIRKIWILIRRPRHPGKQHGG